MQTWQADLLNFVYALATPQGIAGLMLAVVLTIAAVVKPGARWFVLALLMFALTMSKPLGLQNFFNSVLITPLEQIRNNSRALFTMCLLALALPSLTVAREWRQTVVPVPVAAFFAFQLIFSFRDILFYNPTKAAIGVVIFTLTFFVLGVGMTKFLQSTRDARKVLIAIAWAATLMVVLTSMQLAVRSSAITWQNRTYMLSANPQFAAAIIGLALPVLAFLVVDGGLGLFRRVVFAGTAGVLVVFLIWTGSRTGALMAAVGLLLVFRLRMGKFAIAAVVLALGFWVASGYFAGSMEGADRILSTQNTRAGAWRAMYRAFLTSPLIGTHGDDVLGSENSFLFTAASYGLLGLVPLLVATALFARQCFRIQRITRRLGPDQLLGNLVTALIATVFAGSLLEGFLIAQFGFVISMLFLASGIGSLLEDSVRQGAFGSEAVTSRDELPMAALAYES